MSGHNQQSREGAAITKKSGKAKIVIDQANGQFNNGTTFFDRNIKIYQIRLADLIFHSSYLLTKFRIGFIQGRDNTTANNARHCKAKLDDMMVLMVYLSILVHFSIYGN